MARRARAAVRRAPPPPNVTTTRRGKAQRGLGCLGERSGRGAERLDHSSPRMGSAGPSLGSAPSSYLQSPGQRSRGLCRGKWESGRSSPGKALTLKRLKPGPSVGANARALACQAGREGSGVAPSWPQAGGRASWQRRLQCHRLGDRDAVEEHRRRRRRASARSWASPSASPAGGH